MLQQVYLPNTVVFLLVLQVYNNFQRKNESLIFPSIYLQDTSFNINYVIKFVSLKIHHGKLMAKYNKMILNINSKYNALYNNCSLALANAAIRKLSTITLFLHILKDIPY